MRNCAGAFSVAYFSRPLNVNDTMKGRLNWGHRLFSFLLLLLIVVPGRNTNAIGGGGGIYFTLTFFVRTNATSGFITTRGFTSWYGSTDHRRYLTGVRVVPSGAANEWLGIENNKFIRIRNSGEATIETIPGLDLNSSPSAIAFDSTRARAILATSGATPALYQCAAGQSWSLLANLDSINLVALNYSAADDNLCGLQSYTGAPTAAAIFSKFSPQGAWLTNITTTGLFTNVGLGAFACEMTSGTGFGAASHFLMVERPYNQALQPGDLSGRYELSFAGFFETTTLTPGAPTLNFLSPSPRQSLPINTPLTISLSAYDIDGDLRTVQLRDSDTLLKEWTIDEANYDTTNSLQYTWTASSAGSHILSLRGVDSYDSVAEVFTTNDVVTVAVQRFFPQSYIRAGQTITVSLQATPSIGAPAWTVRELAPPNWTVSPENNGSVDPVTHEIIWGPFSDSQNRTLSYQLTAPANSTSSDFAGHVSVNGDTIPFSGPSSIMFVPPTAPTIQFDSGNNANFEVSPGTPMSFKLEAFDMDGDLQSVKLLWNGTLLQTWLFNPIWTPRFERIEASWTPPAAGQYTLTARAEDSVGNVATTTATFQYNIYSSVFVYVYRTMPTNVIAGQTFTVRIGASPGADAHSWFVKEHPPTDWNVTVGSDAPLDPATHEITWGPFNDPTASRMLTYDVIAPVPGATGAFSGQSFMDNIAKDIAGQTNVTALPPTETSVHRIDETHVSFKFNTTPGVGYRIEAADSVDSTNWTYLGAIMGADNPVEFGPVEVQPGQQFFRLRPF